jgi:hypothetical protein
MEESNVFWRLKALAVFTVFFAHLPYSGESQVLIYLFNYLGMVGVPAFLMLAGFFEYTSRSSWSSKLSGLFIPLLIWGTAGYLPSLIFGNMSVGEAIIGYFKWIYGCGSWLYFVPVQAQAPAPAQAPVQAQAPVPILPAQCPLFHQAFPFRYNKLTSNAFLQFLWVQEWCSMSR